MTLKGYMLCLKAVISLFKVIRRWIVGKIAHAFSASEAGYRVNAHLLRSFGRPGLCLHQKLPLTPIIPIHNVYPSIPCP